MPGYHQQNPTGYLECDYENPWPGLVTNLPSSHIPPGAISFGFASNIRGRLQPQLTPYAPTGLTTGAVVMPSFAVNESPQWMDSIPIPGTQNWVTVLVTNLAVYCDYQNPPTAQKTFQQIGAFSTVNPYPQYTKFASTVIGNTMYLSSSDALGVYAIRPYFSVTGFEIVNAGTGFNPPDPTVYFSDGGGTGAAATVSISGHLVIFNLTSGGDRYVTPPLVTVAGGGGTTIGPGQSQAKFVAILGTMPNGYLMQEITATTGVANVTLTNSGHNYTDPQVLFEGGGGTGASGHVVTDQNGNIVGVAVDSPGVNYTSAPTVIIYDATGTGTGATAQANNFIGAPFIGGSFMTTMSESLILGDLIGGDGNSTTGVQSVVVANAGAGYAITSYTPPPLTAFDQNAQNYPTVDFVGGSGSGASAYVVPSTANAVSDGVHAINMGTAVTFSADYASTASAQITNVSSVAGLQNGMTITSTYIPAGTTITNIANGPTGAVITLSQPTNPLIGVNPVATLAYEFLTGNSGGGYVTTPAVNIIGTNGNGTGATAFAQLSPTMLQNSSTTHYPDRVAWSFPGSFGNFDPNNSLGPGGFNTISEARGLVSGICSFESVCFIGHNGGITEMTPNTASSLQPFSFYPLWQSEQSVVCRFGSMAQYGTTACFLSNDNAYSLTPNGLTPIGQNIANLLENQNYTATNPSVWTNTAYPNAGTFGSMVVIEGEMHYLVVTSPFPPAPSNNITVFDFNLANGAWNTWRYNSFTATCPIFQLIDRVPVSPTNGAVDNWLLVGVRNAAGVANTVQMMTVNEQMAYTAAGTLPATPAYAITFYAQFRTESPAIARMLQERRVAFEYENLEELSTSLLFAFTLYGQQDPTQVTNPTGPIINASQQFLSTVQYLPTANYAVIPRQIFSWQVDFSTWTGTCNSIRLQAVANFSLTRMTQVSTLPKAELT